MPFEFKFYHDMTCVATAEQEDDWYDQAEADDDVDTINAHMNRPSTGYIVWKTPADLAAALRYIKASLPVSIPWLFPVDGVTVHSWLRFETMSRLRQTSIEAIGYSYDSEDDEEALWVDLPRGMKPEPTTLWTTCFFRDGEEEEEEKAPAFATRDPRPIRMANMFWGDNIEDDRNQQGCVLFTDIITAVKQKRANQMLAILWAGKSHFVNYLFDRNLMAIVADFL